MNTVVETIPTIWSQPRDGAFFHLVERLFTAQFCLGASVLLASYDKHTPAAGRPTTPGVPLQQVRTPQSAHL